MLIEGPLRIGVLDDPAQPGRELHLDFSTEFQALNEQDQVTVFAAIWRSCSGTSGCCRRRIPTVPVC
jgi:hypothetical protein